MLTMRMTPKISESPLARRKRSAPYDSPLNVWTTQKSERTRDLTQAQHASGVVATDAALILPAEPRRPGGNDGQRPVVAHVEAEVRPEHHAVRAHRGDEIAQRARVVADDVVGEAPEVGAEGLLRHPLRLGSHPLPVTEAAVQIRQRAAGVREADGQFGQPIEHA